MFDDSILSLGLSGQTPPPGHGRKEGDLIAVVQDRVPLRVLFIHGDIEGAVAQLRNASVQQVSDGGGFRERDNVLLEACRLPQTGEKNQAYIHVSTVPWHQADTSRCQSPDFPPRFRSSLISPMVIDFSNAFAIS